MNPDADSDLMITKPEHNPLPTPCFALRAAQGKPET